MAIPQEHPGFLSVRDYLMLPHDNNTWLVKDLIPTSGAALIYGLPKGGKSWLALQLACAIAKGDKEWLGFRVMTQGIVLYLQLDTPRSTWRLRFQGLIREGVKFDERALGVADRESLKYFPFDISKEQPSHMDYLQSMVQRIKPVAVIVDTLRKAHSKDENNSTDMSNVVSKLVAAVSPAALILVSHSRKPNMEMGNDLMSDHRGSGSVTGEMDCIIKMTKKKLYYGGRSIEEGELVLDRLETKDPSVVLYKVRDDAGMKHVYDVINDLSLTSLRQKAKALGTKLGKSEDAAMSLLRRTIDKGAGLTKVVKVAGDTVDVTTGEVVEAQPRVGE